MFNQMENFQCHANLKNKKNGVRFDLKLDHCKQNSSIKTAHVFERTQKKFKTLIRTKSNNAISFRRTSRNNQTQKQNQNDDNKLKIALQDIQQRGATFYRFGFLSNQKNGKKRKTYGDYFNLRYDDMKGTMSTGELWSGKQRSNFLKENKVFVNKVKLVQKISSYKKQCDISKKYIDSENTLFCSFINTLTSPNFGTERRFSSLKLQNQNKPNLSNDLQTLRAQLKNLHRSSKQQEMKNMFKKLQCQTQHMNKIQRKYFIKMIEII